MTRLCIGFEVHQPYRLNPDLRSDRVSGNDSVYFSPANKEILERVADKCYVPATEIILRSLDEGFKCAFSLSGTVIEQLERWRPDALDLFKQVAGHKNAELLAQTYYHSLASLFDDMGEFEEQVLLHKQLLKSVFGIEPTVMENTEFIFNNSIAKSAKRLGFKAIFTEGVERVLGWRSPHYVYTCNGIRLLMRNYHLSDDIAFRFNNREWDQYPLTADKFASWVAGSAGDCANVFIDYETFGEHQWTESGIMEFLKWLPVECKNKGVALLTPGEAADLRPRGELSIEETISWADVEKDASAWLGNAFQRTAFNAIQKAKAYAIGQKLWRCMQTSDHFYYMASKYGSCAEVHSYFSPGEKSAYDFFGVYMKVLSDLELAAVRTMKDPAAAKALRALPPELAFHFRDNEGYAGCTAYCLDDLAHLLNDVPDSSLDHHMRRGDFERWASDVLGDRQLAAEMSKCESRVELQKTADKRRKELWDRVKSVIGEVPTTL